MTNSRPAAQPGQLDHFLAFCKALTLEDGSQFELYPEQVTMLQDYFDGIRESLILISKKNGKSTLLAALGLFHLAVTPDAACYIGAASRDQATILFDQATGFIRRSDSIAHHFDVKGGYREVRSTHDAGRLKVIAADANTADGVIPTLALVDELHRHKSADLYGVFRDGLGPRNGQMVTISTAGDDMNSPLGQLREAARALPGLTREGRYFNVHTAGFVLHEWCLEPDDDREDMSVVKMANPAPWQTEEALAARFNSPSTKPWQWARFACGVWVSGQEGVISDKEWNACREPGLEIPGGASGVYVGIDLGWKRDYTALVPIIKAEELVHVHPPAVLKPPNDGTSILVEDIFEICQEYADRWPELTFVMDPEAGGELLAQRLDTELSNTTVITHSQKNAPMVRASMRLAEAIAERRIRHPDDSELNQHILGAGYRAVGEGWRFAKQPKKDLKIDATVALAMAHNILTEAPRSKPATMTFLD